MATTERSAVQGLATRIAGFGLPDRPAQDPREVPPNAWPALLGRFSFERLTGLAVAAARAGELVLSDEQADELLDQQQLAMTWCLGLERTLLDLAGAFDERGIEFVVLKGPSLAHTIYPDPSWRPFGDLDLLVGTRDWRRALALLAGLEMRRLLPEPRRGFDERFGKAATHRTADGQEIDLHRTLVLGPFGLRIDPEELMDRAVEFRIGDRSLRRLDAAGTFLEGCLHSALGLRTPLLHTIRDVAQSREAGGVDWDAVSRWSRDWHLAPVIDRALQLAAETFGTAWPVEAGGALRPATGAERRAVEAYTTERRARGGTAVATLRAIRGVRAKAAYLRAMVLPDRRFLDQRPHRLRRAAGWMVGRR